MHEFIWFPSPNQKIQFSEASKKATLPETNSSHPENLGLDDEILFGARSELLALGSATISIHFEFLQSWLQVTKAHLARQVRELEVFGGGGGGEYQSFRMTKIRQNWGFSWVLCHLFWMGEDEFYHGFLQCFIFMYIIFQTNKWTFSKKAGWFLTWIFQTFVLKMDTLKPNQLHKPPGLG